MKLHTERRGSGPLLVCHPGGPGFDGGELRDLGGLDATRTLLLVDPRGSGRTGPADSYALDDYVGDLEELRADLALETIDLLGFSHGGLVAAAYAAAYPQHVRKLVLAGGFAAFAQEMRDEVLRVVEAKAEEPWHAVAAAALDRKEEGDDWAAEDTAARWNEMVPFYFARWDERYRPLVEVAALAPGPGRTFNESEFDLRPELDRIDADTLVITGREDFICGPVAAQPLADGIPTAELVLLDGAGHFPFLEQPDAFRTAVEDFLSR